jgi:hypothetical protein
MYMNEPPAVVMLAVLPPGVSQARDNRSTNSTRARHIVDATRGYGEHFINRATVEGHQRFDLT